MLPATIQSAHNDVTVSRRDVPNDALPVRIDVGSGTVRRFTPENAKALAAALLEAAETPKSKADRIREILGDGQAPYSQRLRIHAILDEDGDL